MEIKNLISAVDALNFMATKTNISINGYLKQNKQYSLEATVVVDTINHKNILKFSS